MWYFAWILGVLLACSFGILNAMWLESRYDQDKLQSQSDGDSSNGNNDDNNSHQDNKAHHSDVV